MKKTALIYFQYCPNDFCFEIQIYKFYRKVITCLLCPNTLRKNDSKQNKKRFFNQRSTGTFEEPIKVLGITCKISSRRGRTFKGSRTQNFLRVPPERWLKNLFWFYLEPLFLRVNLLLWCSGIGVPLTLLLYLSNKM